MTGGASGIGRAIASDLAANGACVVVADLDLAKAEDVARRTLGALMLPLGWRSTFRSKAPFNPAWTLPFLPSEDSISWSIALGFRCPSHSWRRPKPIGISSTTSWLREAFSYRKSAARAMIGQGLGGDIVYICSKNAVFAGPNNVAYSAAKADQAHQVRLLAAELGSEGIRVNGINPDGVVRGSGIFASGWGAERAKVYGVPEDELGAFYASRTLLGTRGPARRHCSRR